MKKTLLVLAATFGIASALLTTTPEPRNQKSWVVEHWEGLAPKTTGAIRHPKLTRIKNRTIQTTLFVGSLILAPITFPIASLVIYWSMKNFGKIRK